MSSINGRPDIVNIIREGAQLKLKKSANNPKVQLTISNSNTLKSLTWRDIYAHQPVYIDIIFGKEIHVHQLRNGELNGVGTGAMVWPAACVLVKYLEHKYRDYLPEATVIDLGSGTGIAGIAASIIGASTVFLTDQKNVLPLTRMNRDKVMETFLKSDASGKNIFVEEYNWGDSGNVLFSKASEYLGSQLQGFDMILVSDCILPKLFPIEPLCKAIEELVNESSVVIMSYEYRYYHRYDPKEKFFNIMKQKGFLISVIQQDEMHPNYRLDDIEIWELRRV